MLFIALNVARMSGMSGIYICRSLSSLRKQTRRIFRFVLGSQKITVFFGGAKKPDPCVLADYSFSDQLKTKPRKALNEVYLEFFSFVNFKMSELQAFYRNREV